jgi:threonyl-tRNA synthetase
MERVVASVLERYQGRLPLWLAPVQLCVLPVGPEQDGAARRLLDDALAAGLRTVVEHEGSLGSRVRRCRQRRDCVMAVVGPSEVAADAAQVTDISAGFRGQVERSALIDVLSRSQASRANAIDWPPP